nr:flagellar protein FlhE [Cupriavidus gilardii]
MLSMTATVTATGVAASPLIHTNFGGDSRHAWTASVPAPALHGRGVRALSAPILPSGYLTQSEGVITAVRWRYRFARVPPPNLQAYLCNANRCVLLPGPEGKTDAFRGDDADKGFVFAFRIPGQGPLTPVLQGQTSQVTVNYR